MALRNSSKAAASAAVGLVGYLLLKWGVKLDPELEALLLSLVAGLAVYFVPNKA